VEESERHHKRQKKDDLTIVMAAHEASLGIEASEEITTQAATDHIDALRDAWLRKERLRSDPQKEWLEEEV
jgi:hypothetical protein